MAEQRNNDRPMVSMRPGGRRGGPGGPMIREKPKNAKGTFLKLTKYIGKNRYLLIGLLVLVIFISILNLAGPSLQAAAIDSMSHNDIVGSVAGDDTIIIVMRTNEAASTLIAELRSIIDK